MTSTDFRALGRLGQQRDLLLLGRERLHHPRARHVLLDDGGDVGRAGLHDPADREQELSHPDAGHVHERQWRHVDELVQDARDKGARVIPLTGTREEHTAENRVYPPTLLLEVDDSMAVMQEEIFGPVLPVVTYPRLDDALRYVQDRPRPLALYYFDRDGDRVERVIRDTVSGGVTVNDVIYHIGQHDLPFGGVGASGMGHYHGRHGFETFSHEKSVFEQSRFSPTALIKPPYGRVARKLIDFLVGG